MGNKKSKNAKVGEIWSIRGAESKGHPSIITKKRKKNEIEHISITHSPKTRNMKNIKLRKAPNIEDPRDNYILPKVLKTNANNLHRKRPEMKIRDPIDKSIIRNIKKKRK